MARRDSPQSAKHPTAGLSYEHIRAFRDGVYRPMVRVRCVICHERTDILCNSTDPAFIKRQWQNRRWDFHPFDSRKCVCPRCKKGDPEDMNTAAKHAVPKTTRPNGLHPDSTTMTSVAAVTMNLPRQLIPEEKARVRHLLDNHFDETLGRYIDGYSDKRIGEETNLPWASVRDYRDMAYGPIKEDPAIAEMRVELAKSRELVSAAMAKLDAIELKLGSLGS